MPARVFRNDDDAYQRWLHAHPDGWVINARCAPTPKYLKLHRTRCASISQLQHGYSTWTGGDCIKVCADTDAELAEWCKSRVGGEPQRGCYCVSHGLNASRATRWAEPAEPPDDAADQPAFEADEHGFAVVRTDAIVPFQPRTTALADTRRRLRRVLGPLIAQPGQFLHAAIAGALTRATDLDNALLYNVGGRIELAARYGVLLERSHARDDPTQVEYRYRLTSEPSWVFQRVLALVAEAPAVALHRAPRGWCDVWAAMHHSQVVVQSVALDEPIGVDVVLDCPRYRGAATAQLVKTLLDGVLTAVHSADPSDPDVPEVAQRLASLLSTDAETVRGRLLRRDTAALGMRPRLVWRRGSGVQCSPDDLRVAALRLRLNREAQSWAIHAAVSVVEPLATAA